MRYEIYALKEELDNSTVANFATTTQHGAIEGNGDIFVKTIILTEPNLS